MAISSGTNAIRRLGMDAAVRAIDKYGSVAKSCRFAVTIKPSGSNNLLTNYQGLMGEMVYVCDAAEFPGRGFSVTEARYYGPSRVFPTNVEYQPLALSFICRTASPERLLFDDWMDIINPTTTFNFNYPEEYYCDLDIFQYAEYGLNKSPSVNEPQHTPVYAWRFKKAWPQLVSPQQVTWGDQDILRLQVQFAYQYWERPDVTR